LLLEADKILTYFFIAVALLPLLQLMQCTMLNSTVKTLLNSGLQVSSTLFPHTSLLLRTQFNPNI